MLSVAANSTSSGPWLRAFAVCGSVVLVVAALFWARVVLIPLVLAILFGFILTPVVQVLQRWGLNRIFAAIVAVLVPVMVICGLGAAMLIQAQGLATDLEKNKEKIAEKVSSIQDWLKGSWVERVGGAVQKMGEKANEADSDWDKAAREPIPVRVVTSRLPVVRSAVFNSLEMVITTGIVLVLMVFILVLREDLRNRLIRLLGRENLTTMTKALDDAGVRISRYLGMQLLVNISFGLAITLGLFLIGIPYAFLWGVLAGALRYIPYLGAWLGSILPLALSVLIFPDWTHSVLVALLFTGLELSISFALEPWLYGHSIGVSGIALLFATIFWTWLWGPIGLLLTTPLTACLMVLGRYVPHMGFLNILLGVQPVLKPHETYYQRLLARAQDEAIDLVEERLQKHSVTEVLETLLLPSLILTKKNKQRSEFTTDDERYILEAIRETLDDLGHIRCRQKARAEAPIPAKGERIRVFGCPAHDEEDELALLLFRQELDEPKCDFEVVSATVMAGEVVSRVRKEQPALVCIAALPASGCAPARYLCKRLRAVCPDLKIVIGCWGLNDNVELIRERLRSAGADFVGLTLQETRGQVISLLEILLESLQAKPRALASR
jgi:predicted PurR-regulated permease PerM